MDWRRRGIRATSIIVWDRSLGGIKEAGYRPALMGINCVRLLRAKDTIRRQSFPRRC